MDKKRKKHGPRPKSKERPSSSQRSVTFPRGRSQPNYRGHGRDRGQHWQHDRNHEAPLLDHRKNSAWSYDHGRYYEPNNSRYQDERYYPSQQWNNSLYMPFSSEARQSQYQTPWLDDCPPQSGNFNPHQSGNFNPPPNDKFHFSRSQAWNSEPLRNEHDLEGYLDSRSIFDSEQDFSGKKSLKPSEDSPEKDSVDSHSLELSLKATSIIDSILKGEKAPIKRPEKKAIKKGKDEDIIEKAKKICQENKRIREARLLATQESISGINNVKGNGVPTVTGTRRKAGNKPSATSTVTSSSTSTPSLRTSESPKRYTRVTKSIPLKESVLKMIKYPKSRRGTAQIDKLLKKTAAPLHSKQRLLSLMQPDDPNMKFTQLAPDVQKDILNLIDEVMVDFNSDDYISLSDDDRSDLASPRSRSRQSSLTECLTPTSSRVRSNSTHVINDVLPEDDWRDILSSAGFDNLNEDPATEDCTSRHQGDLLVGNFPPSMNEGLKIVDRVIREKKSGLGNTPHPHNTEQQKIKSLADIKNEKITNDNVTFEAPDCELLLSPPSGVHSHGNERFHRESAQERNPLKQEDKQTISQSIINDADIICIKPEPRDLSYENQVIEIPDDEQNEGTETQHMDTGPSIQEKQFTGSLEMSRESLIVQGQGDHISLDVVQLSDSDMEASNDVEDTASKSRSKRSREPISPEKTSEATSASPDSLVAKRPKVNDSETDSSAMMEEIYNITMEEEEVRDKMTDTDKVIRELLENLEVMKRRRQELEDQEIQLRKRRLEILRGAKLGHRSYSDSQCGEKASSVCSGTVSVITSGEAVTSPNQAVTNQPQSVVAGSKKHAQIRNLSMSSVESTSDVKRSRKASTASIENLTNEDIDVKMEPDTTVSCVIPMDINNDVSTSNVDTLTRLDNDTGAVTTHNESRRPEDQAENASVENEVDLENVAQQAPMSLQYLGSFTAEANVQSILKQLSKNFSNLKQVSSVMLDDGQRLDLIGKSADHTEDCSTAKQLSPDTSTVKQLSPDTSTSQFKVPENPPPDSVQSTVKTKASPQSEKPSRKNRSKKKKNQAKSETPVSSDDDNKSGSTPSKRSSKKVTKDKATSKIMKEYLHCSSSSDVEISGLDSKTSSVSAAVTHGKKLALEDFYNSDDAEDATKLLEPSSVSSLKRTTRSSSVFPLYVAKTFTGRPRRKGNRISMNHHPTSKSNPTPGVFSDKVCGPINCMANWKKDILVTGGDFKIRYHNKRECGRTRKRMIDGHKDHVKFLHVCHEPSVFPLFVYSGGADKTFIISKWEDCKPILEHTCPAPVTCGAVLWGKIYIGLSNGMIIIVEQNRVEKTYQAASSDHAILTIALGQEGTRKILAYSEQNEQAITLRDARNNLFIRCLEGHTRAVSCLKIRHHQVYSGGDDNMVQIHNILTGTMETLLRFQSHVTALVIDKWLIVGEKRGVIDIIETKHHARLHVVYTHDHSPVTALVYDHVISFLYIGEETGTVEAVALDNDIHKCQFAACKGYSFGEARYMINHIMIDHVEPCLRGAQHSKNKPTGYKCLWKGCDEFVETDMNKDLLSQDPLLDHLSAHVYEEFSCSDVQV